LIDRRLRLRLQAAPLIGTGVIHGDIQAAKALDSLADEIAHVILAAHIGAHEFSLGAESAQFSDQCLPASSRRPRITTREPSWANAKAVAADAGKRARDEHDCVGVQVLCPLGD
jgi:hypothetical protein